MSGDLKNFLQRRKRQKLETVKILKTASLSSYVGAGLKVYVASFNVINANFTLFEPVANMVIQFFTTS